MELSLLIKPTRFLPSGVSGPSRAEFEGGWVGDCTFCPELVFSFGGAEFQFCWLAACGRNLHTTWTFEDRVNCSVVIVQTQPEQLKSIQNDDRKWIEKVKLEVQKLRHITHFCHQWLHLHYGEHTIHATQRSNSVIARNFIRYSPRVLKPTVNLEPASELPVSLTSQHI